MSEVSLLIEIFEGKWGIAFAVAIIGIVFRNGIKNILIHKYKKYARSIASIMSYSIISICQFILFKTTDLKFEGMLRETAFSLLLILLYCEWLEPRYFRKDRSPK